MEQNEAVRSLMFSLTYMLMKRRRDLSNAESRRRHEAERRIRHRQYFLQRHRRMLMMLITQCTRPTGVARTRAWTNTASTDWWERVVLTEFQPSDWLERFRMSRETFFHLCNKLRPWLARQDTCLRPALALEKRVALVLWRLASNVEYRTIGELFGVGRSTVCKCVREVCHAIGATLRPLYLREPSEQELEDSARLFSTRWGFPNCVGVVGNLHVPIIAPAIDADSYWNSRGWHSVITQGAVNGVGQFWDVCAGFPGSTDPTNLLQNSSLWSLGHEGRLSPESMPRSLMGKRLGSVVLGDAAYPLQTWLLKAYKKSDKLTVGQRAFNKRLERARTMVDEAFMRLKARWQCLLKRNDCHVDGVPAMIVACCVLHNMCEVHGDELADEWLEAARRDENPKPVHRVLASDDDPAGEEVRALYCEYFLQQENQQNQQQSNRV